MVIQNKKIKEIRICVGFRKLNKDCIYGSFPTPFTKEILESVVGKEIYSFTNRFSGYHQVKIREEDYPKITMAK